MKLVDEIMPTVEVRLMDDKTLWVKVGNVEQIGRVIVEDGTMFCRVFYAEPGRGEWILADEQRKEDTDNDNYRYICSNCNHSDIHSKTQEVPFCWNCGADMRGEE